MGRRLHRLGQSGAGKGRGDYNKRHKKGQLTNRASGGSTRGTGVGATHVSGRGSGVNPRGRRRK